MRVKTDFTVMEHSGFAMICFMVAAFGRPQILTIQKYGHRNLPRKTEVR